MYNMSTKDLTVKALVEISEALASAYDLEKTLNSILKVFSELLEMQRGTITLVDPATNELHIEVAQGLSPAEKERGGWEIKEELF